MRLKAIFCLLICMVLICVCCKNNRTSVLIENNECVTDSVNVAQIDTIVNNSIDSLNVE